ncbi:MAG: hypothetical protein JWP69_913 [Flaviaesturariibacter sp.]|nr:hypothetical protein [Flaviaesturariibacter sp.]
MIISRIIGGLGNQLFQYAAGKALAEMHGVELKLDTCLFSTEQLRNFDLSQLNADVSIATNEEIATLKAANSRQRIRSYLTAYKSKTFYKEPFFHFDPKFRKLSKNIYVQGYFQSEKYFLSIQHKIRELFQPKESVIATVLEFGKALNEHNSVAIHIRRGDYSNETTRKVHGIIPLSYYEDAVKIIQTKIAAPRFYIFSDDGAWVQENLAIPNAAVVSGVQSKTHFEDLFLMSQCRHNIIANSSFSWWGAWLNANSNKTVIAPKQWFNQGPKDTQDLIPERWIKI